MRIAMRGFLGHNKDRGALEKPRHKGKNRRERNDDDYPDPKCLADLFYEPSRI